MFEIMNVIHVCRNVVHNGSLKHGTDPRIECPVQKQFSSVDYPCCDYHDVKSNFHVLYPSHNSFFQEDWTESTKRTTDNQFGA